MSLTQTCNTKRADWRKKTLFKRQTKTQRLRQSVLSVRVNLEVPMGVMERRVPKDTVPPQCLTSELSPDQVFQSRGEVNKKWEEKTERERGKMEGRIMGSRESREKT